MRGREAAVKAVSAPAKNAEQQSKKTMMTIIATMVGT